MWEATTDTLALILFNGIRIAVVYVLYSEAIRLTGHPVLVAAVVALEVPLTIGVETWFFVQPVSGTLIIGALIILIGVVSIIHENELLKRATA